MLTGFPSLLFTAPRLKSRHVFRDGEWSRRTSRSLSVHSLSQGETSAEESEYASHTDGSGWEDEEAEDAISTSKRRRTYSRQVDTRNFRHVHLTRVYDLLMLSVSRNDVSRAQRCLNILLRSHELSPEDLWRHALQVRSMSIASQDADSGMSQAERTRHLARERLTFLRKVLDERGNKLQADVLIEIIPELMALGEEDQAFEEIEMVLNRYPFRMEPLLHLYGALLYLSLSMRAMTLNADEERDAKRIQLKDVPEIDQIRACVPSVLLLRAHRGDENARMTLKRATERFQAAVNVGKLAPQRGRRDVRSATGTSRSQSRSRSRSRSRSVSRVRRRGDMESGGSESEADGRYPQKRVRRGSESEPDTGTDVSLPDNISVEIANDDWARDLARAYIAVLQASNSLTIEDAGHDTEDSDESSDG